jgi:hypothetical protein
MPLGYLRPGAGTRAMSPKPVPPAATTTARPVAVAAATACRKWTSVRLRQWPEFLEVVFGIQAVVVDVRLSDDGVEEETAGGHPAAGRRGRIALGIRQQIAVRVDRKLEVPGDQDHLPPGRSEFLPVLVRVAVDRVARQHAGDVQTHGVGQVLFDEPEHVVWHVNPDGTTLEAVVRSQSLDAQGVHSRHRGASEIHRDPIRFLMGERGPNPFTARHWRFLSRAHVSKRMRPGGFSRVLAEAENHAAPLSRRIRRLQACTGVKSPIPTSGSVRRISRTSSTSATTASSVARIGLAPITTWPAYTFPT